MSDPINHPAHYTARKVEAIEVTEDLNFCLGNAVKYILRCDHKGKPLEDLEKAVWYLNREIARRKHAEMQTRALVAAQDHINETLARLEALE